jgi:hypothetical protein
MTIRTILFQKISLLHFASISSSSFEDLGKAIGGGMNVCFVMNARHIVVLKFERMVT